MLLEENKNLQQDYEKLSRTLEEQSKGGVQTSSKGYILFEEEIWRKNKIIEDLQEKLTKLQTTQPLAKSQKHLQDWLNESQVLNGNEKSPVKMKSVRGILEE